MILQDKNGQSGLHRGKGGRVEELERPEVMVDEFRDRGEEKVSAHQRVGEGIFQQYDPKLKETEASHGIHFVIMYTIKVSIPAGSSI